MSGIYIPAPPPIPLPIWPHFLLFIGLLTLAVHFVLIQSTLASVLTAAFSRDHAQTVLARAPILMAFVINLGIPPLLVVQSLYGSLFYSGSLLIAKPWLSVVFLIMASYGLIYFARYTSRLDFSRWASLAAALGILSVAFIYSNVMSWMIHPGGWAEAYKAGGAAHFYPRSEEAILRWAWILGPAICWMGWMWPSRFRAFFFTGIIVSGAAFGLLMSNIQYPIPASQKMYQWASFGLLAGTALFGLDSSGKVRCFVMVSLALDALAKVLTRHWIRESVLGDIYNFQAIPIQIQQSVIVAVVATLLFGVVMGLWMWQIVRKQGIAL
ncbi:hypothetical protein HY522_08400 [bacterium]|nr:hypothetical protein [bacterium]